MRIGCRRNILLILLCLYTPLLIMAGAITRVSGVVLDATTGETIPMAQILFEGSSVGTTSDLDGNFSIQHDKAWSLLNFRMIGYKTKSVVVKLGRSQELIVQMEPEVYALQDVVVTPKRRREHYRRKGNPAVELIRNVIAHVDANNFSSSSTRKVECYEKMVMAVEPFDIDLQKTKLRRKFLFVENYLDTMLLEDGALVVDSGMVRVDTVRLGEDSILINTDSFVIATNQQHLDTNQTPILTISVREYLTDEYLTAAPGSKQYCVVKAKRREGLDEILDNGGLDANLQMMFQPVNIFASDINLMTNRFVSPLSSSLAVSFYHYYIMDTLEIDHTRCIDLAFVPVNPESFGFSGHLYIVDDSTYALKRYKINVPTKINLNWLNYMKISETFVQHPSHQWVSNEVNTHVRFALRRKAKHDLYVRQTRVYSHYDMDAQVPDSLFVMAGNRVVLDGADTLTSSDWAALRPTPITAKESVIDSLETELMRVPEFRGLVHTVEDLIQEFIPTSRIRNASKWDFGPIFNTISYNEQEGCRVRIGGMTTANLHPRWFASGYVAYGVDDQRVKGGVTLLHSFHDKPYHPYESLRHNLSLTASYDLEELGQSYRVLDRDHIFMSIKFNYQPKPMQYVARLKLKYEKEWANQLSIVTWGEFMHNQPNGSSMDFGYGKMRLNREDHAMLMSYQIEQTNHKLVELPYYHEAMWTAQLRYSPGGFIYNDRQGIESVFNLWKDAPVFRLTNEVGYILEGQYWYDRIQLSAEKRFWLSAFGHLDLTLDAGYIAGDKVPYTRLFIPVSNQSILLDPKAFNLMQPAEFIMDRYASLHLTYYMKGWLFNRIPGLKALHLREVVSFHMLAGYLGNRNNPNVTSGLFQFPETYSVNNEQTGAVEYMHARDDFRDGKYAYMPYMELTAGIENIFKLLRVEYVRRLTHLETPQGGKLGPWQRNGIRITLRVAM